MCSLTLLADPKNPATATAANNLLRCWMGGGGNVLIIVMIDRLDCGVAFTLVAAILLVATSIQLVLLRWGQAWREARLKE